MNQYYITVSTGISGYDFDEVIEANTEEEAREEAIKSVKERIAYMMNHVKVTKVEE